MKELRENIASIISDGFFLAEDNPVCRGVAINILSSPTNLRAERECGACQGGTARRSLGGIITEPKDCPACKGAGKISRPLTLQEAVEWAKEIVHFMNRNPGKPVFNSYPTVPSGERIVPTGEKNG